MLRLPGEIDRRPPDALGCLGHQAVEADPGQLAHRLQLAAAFFVQHGHTAQMRPEAPQTVGARGGQLARTGSTDASRFDTALCQEQPCSCAACVPFNCRCASMIRTKLHPIQRIWP